MSKWTADDIPDQTGKRIVITGANAGLGLESAKQLAARGAEVVLACRNPAKGDAALAEVGRIATGAAPSLVRLDLADLDSVATAADEIHERFGSVDVLMNNAGLMAIPHREVTPQGNEMQFGVNHLGHFALALRLLPALLKTHAPRVVALGSIVHLGGRINLEDLNAATSYKPWQVYAQSKLACMLFAFELDRRAKAAGLPLRAMAAHPGYSSTNLQSTGPLAGGLHPINWVMAKATPLIAQPARIGALGQLRAATDPSLSGGDYVGGTVLFGARGYPKQAYTTPRARNEHIAAELWSDSERLTGLSFSAALGAAAA